MKRREELEGEMESLRCLRSWPAVFLLLLCLPSSVQSSLLLNRYTLHGMISEEQPQEPQEYIDPTDPPILSNELPSCSVQLLDRDFAYTYGSPPAYNNFTIPASCQWSRAVLELAASCAGEQYDRIGAAWIDGVEVLRTSTAEPTEWGIFWTIRKDVTRYSSLFDDPKKLHHVWLMLENIVDDVYTGIYHLNLSLHFYHEETESEPRSRSLLGSIPQQHREMIEKLARDPADLILPITHERGSSEGFWFRIQSEADAKAGSVEIPKNAYRAVLEIYASSHGDDEFWYSNPPSFYIEQNHITPPRGNGAFREVYATIDGLYAGSVLPFPAIFTGGFNPLLWAPVTPLASFDLPSYLLDLTPFLGALLNGSSHRIGLSVSHSLPFWFLGGNLHLWLDPELSSITSRLVKHQAPPAAISYSNESHFLDGVFKLEAERTARFEGWVSSSMGNLTYFLDQKFKYRSSVSYENNGSYKGVYSKAKLKTELKVEETAKGILFKVYRKAKYPVRVSVATEGGFARMNVSHGMQETSSLSLGSAVFRSSTSGRQEARGWMEFEDHSVLSGSGSSRQTYKQEEDGRCFVRVVSAEDGFLLSDLNSTDCRFSQRDDRDGEGREQEGYCSSAVACGSKK